MKEKMYKNLGIYEACFAVVSALLLTGSGILYLGYMIIGS
jgi:hypothetical protein